MFAFAVASLIAAAGEPASSCTDAAARVVQPALFSAPDGPAIHATNRRVRLLIDLGSDGRERRVAIVESSGDSTVDTAALDAVKQMRFAPPVQNCLSTSFTAPQSFNVALITLATPAPGATAAPAAICSAPFVQLSGIDVPVHRSAPGTVAIDVRLTAAAAVTSVRLASSSGRQQTDTAALAAARTAQYQFVSEPGCAPKPTTYRLELTYH